MVYYALRSNNQYLQLLEQIKCSPYDHNILTIAGGMAFLHALGKNTRSLTIVDSDSEVLDYVDLMIRLISKADSLYQLISAISGHKVIAGPPEVLKLGGPINQKDLLGDIFGKQTYIDRYFSYYGNWTFDTTTNTGTKGESTIHLGAGHLQPMHFSWRFGDGNFSDEYSFQLLKNKLNSVPVKILMVRLEELDFSVIPYDLPTISLVSNADSPIFTKRDLIFRHMLKSFNKKFRYVSWVRDVEIENPLLVDLNRPNLEDILLEIKSSYEFLSDVSHALFPNLEQVFKFKTISDLVSNSPHGNEMFLSYIDIQTALTLLPELLDAIVPTFKRIIFILNTQENQKTLYDNLVREGLLESYKIYTLTKSFTTPSQIDSSNTNTQLLTKYLILAELHGMLPPKY